MKTSDIAIVILSCDKFNVTWKPCIDHLFSAWHDCSYPVYLLNNFISSNDNRVTDLLVGEDLSWSDSLRNGLLKITEKRVFFIYDDSFISDLDKYEIEEIFDIAVRNDLNSVVLRKNLFDNGVRFDERLFKLNPTTKYRNSLFLNLIKKEVLLNLLRPSENAWQFEKDGNERSKYFDFYSVYNANLAKYHHGIVKGKWLPKTKKYLKQNGFNLENDVIKSHSFLRIIAMNIYIFIYIFSNKLIALYRQLSKVFQ